MLLHVEIRLFCRYEICILVDSNLNYDTNSAGRNRRERERKRVFGDLV